MTPTKTFAPAALTLAGLAVCASAPGCGPASPPPASAGVAAEAAPSRVAVARPERATLRRVASQPGQIEAFEVAAVRAKIAGYVRSMAVNIGHRVEKGQVIAEIHVPEFEADLKQKRAMVEAADAQVVLAESEVKVAEAHIASARAKLAETEARINKADADLEFAKIEYNRTNQLVSRRAETQSLLDEARSVLRKAEAARVEAVAVSDSARSTLEEVEAELEKARSQVAAAEANVEVARAEAERAEALLAYARVEAPFDGVVTRRPIDPGHMTSGQGTGDPLFIIARSDLVTITVGVPEVDAPYVNPGDTAEVRLQAQAGRAIAGTVTRTAWALDAATRTLQTEIDLPAADNGLQPGLYAYVDIVAEEHADALTVPALAVLREGGRSFVVVADGSRAARREVRPGLSDGKRTEIAEGLGEDDLVIVSGAGNLEDGQRIDWDEPPAGPTP